MDALRWFVEECQTEQRRCTHGKTIEPSAEQ